GGTRRHAYAAATGPRPVVAAIAGAAAFAVARVRRAARIGFHRGSQQCRHAAVTQLPAPRDPAATARPLATRGRFDPAQRRAEPRRRRRLALAMAGGAGAPARPGHG